MEHLLTIGLVSVMGFSLGLLLMRLFGAPGDHGPLEDAVVRLQSASLLRR